MGVPLRVVRTDEPPRADLQKSNFTNEIELVARCQRGERRAFDELYSSYRNLVAANLYRILGRGSDLEDTLQEVFIEVFRSIGRFRGDSRLSTWLYSVSANIAYRRLRTRRRKEPKVSPLPMNLAARGPDLERQIDSKNQLEKVHQILDTLAPKKRIAFVLHELEGLDIEEIAAIVGAPRVTVRTRIHYARREFYERAAALLGHEALPVALRKEKE